MVPVQTRSKCRRVALVVLLFCALGLSVAIVASLLQQRRDKSQLAEAQAQLRAVQRNLQAAMHVATTADALSQRVGGTNSSFTQTVRSIGDSAVQKLQKESMIAAVNVNLAGIVEAADHCVQSYADEDSAQEAMAALNLSGIKHVVIRPPGRSNSGAGQSSYDVMVPHDSAARASEVLQHPQISEVKTFGDFSSAVQAMQALEAWGIHATLRPMKVAERSDTMNRVFRVFVLSADAESAKTHLRGPSVNDTISF